MYNNIISLIQSFYNLDNTWHIIFNPLSNDNGLTCKLTQKINNVKFIIYPHFGSYYITLKLYPIHNKNYISYNDNNGINHKLYFTLQFINNNGWKYIDNIDYLCILSNDMILISKYIRIIKQNTYNINVDCEGNAIIQKV